uniref:Uncharacterized protein n=1 Tax=Sciurus vulgaris TaxID=55149 RepID=A0A8D2DLU0_SCIVU
TLPLVSAPFCLGPLPSLAAWGLTLPACRARSPVASGGRVTLLCHTPHSCDVFTLQRRGSSLPQDCPQQGHSSFLISPVGQAHGGTCRYYGFVSHSPHLWSLPSDPLELWVTGECVSDHCAFVLLPGCLEVFCSAPWVCRGGTLHPALAEVPPCDLPT